jgi:hypothetical protein
MKELPPKTLRFFEKIQTWMIANDYECGEEGTEIFDEISKILEENEWTD